MNVRTLVGLALFGAAAGLHADAAKALADYKLGQQYQVAKQWGPAARQYLQVLKDEPKDLWAYKSLGTVYYQAGDHKGALAYYDRYLHYYPNDKATQNFADALRAQLGQAAPVAAGAPIARSAARPPRARGGFSVRLDGAFLMSSGGDITQYYSSFGNTVSGGSGVFLGGGIAADYAWENGLVIGADLMDGPNRSYSVSSGSSSTQWQINNIILGVSPGWRFHWGRRWLLEPRLGLGYMLSSLTVAGTSASASGLEAWPQLRAECLFGRFGLGASLGYLYAHLSPVTGSFGTIKLADGSAWVMDNGGPTLGIYGVWHFNPPF